MRTADAGDHGPNYLGNDGRPGQYGSAYDAPRSNSDSQVAVANLPDPPPSSPNYGQRGQYDQRNQPPYDQRGQQPNNQYDQRSQQPYDQRNSQGYNPPPPARTALRKGESIDVQPGDTLYKLSRRHHVSVAELMDVMASATRACSRGRRSICPRATPRAMTSPARSPASAAAAPPSASVPADLQAKYSGSYTVRQGEPFYGISRTYGVPVAELQQANGITDPRGVRTGTVLEGSGRLAVCAAPAVRPMSPTRPRRLPARRQDPTIIDRRDTTRVGEPQRQCLDDRRRLPRPAQAPAPEAWRATNCAGAPVNGKIITGFGQRNDGTQTTASTCRAAGHGGACAESGVVAYAGSELKGYGNLVLLRHDNGWVTAYAHNDELMVKRGDKVQRGQVIAKAGAHGLRRPAAGALRAAARVKARRSGAVPRAAVGQGGLAGVGEEI